jgi:phosphoglycolate phosphatase
MLTIVFDLDGTLIDTAPDLVDTLNIVFAREGLPGLPFAVARPLIGGGARAMIERALGAEGKTASETDIDRMFTAFIAHYADHIADRSWPFPELEITLDRLASAGHSLAICTNKPEWLSVRLLNALKLTDRFAAICGQDTFAMRKPDPDMLRLTIKRAGGEVRRAIMVGDSETDVRTARAAEVPIIAVDFGYSEVPVAALRPDRIIGSFAELPTAIHEITVEHS